MYTTLYFQGEPLLNRNFTEIVQYVRSKNILTATSTNSQLIDDNLAKSLVLSGLDRLPLSINFWRTFMHWIGGLGVVVLAVAILPMFPSGYLRQNAGVRTTSRVKISSRPINMAKVHTQV